jgi:two-component system chemotaxis response regulator CheB
MIRVLVVDDSAYSRRVITKILESIPEVQVVETATDGQDALKKTIRLRPDLITLDLQMPLMDGFTFLRWVMSSLPTPVIVVSSQEHDENVFKAMDLGAFDFVVKPTSHPSSQLEAIEADLIEKVLAVPLLQARNTRQKMEAEVQQTKLFFSNAAPSEKPRIIGIASSTGGPPAIQQILNGLPRHFDVPIIIAQHMPAGFTSLFAERLNRHVSLRVQEASEDIPLEAGNVYIAPGGKHVIVERTGNRLMMRIHERKHRYSPSGDLLFESIAASLGSNAIGAVLTGMGDDGKTGLMRIKEKNGITIAESERTAIIFGMPHESIKAGVVDYVLPLHEIPIALTSLCRM